MYSNLIQLEVTGIIEKLYVLNRLDKNFGIIKKDSNTLPESKENALTVFANGGYDEKYGMDVINRFFAFTPVTVVSASRENGIGTFSAEVKSSFAKLNFDIKFPKEAY